MKSIGITLLVIVVVNLISFIIDYLKIDTTNDFSLKFDNGMFWVNGNRAGMDFTDIKYWLFYILVFSVAFFYFKKRSKVS
ncbi:hypothetical protein ACFS5M_00980 [Lacinutrix iliipiscaria]|uniref:Signal peptidase II n=1 Tax=Lacinutrix iliipiscaria TaxID=1230532 RepID=A0ABW5WHS2_9FLAO